MKDMDQNSPVAEWIQVTKSKFSQIYKISNIVSTRGLRVKVANFIGLVNF